MALPDFTIEYDSEVPNFPEELKQEVETRLSTLAEGHTDMTGAAVGVTQPARAQDPFIFQARIVVYTRPEDIAAVKKDGTLEGAIKAALTAIERQIREKRKKLGEPWKRPDLLDT